MIARDGDHATLSFQVGDRELWFRVAAEHADFLSPRADAAVVALLAGAHTSGIGLDVHGEISHRLAFQLDHGMHAFLHSYFPGRPGTTIRWLGTRASAPAGRGDAVLTGLSCGVDSLTAFHDHLLDPEVPESMRITHFLHNDTGGHRRDAHPDSGPLFQARFEAAATLAREVDIPILQVATNLDDFDPNPFISTHIFRNAAVAMALQGRARLWLYASSFHLREARVVPGDIAHSDWLILPLLSNGTLECMSVCGRLTRVERTRLLSQLPLAQRHLNVCVREANNCSTCWKCARTLLTLELVGEARAFSQVFDLSRFAKVRDGYVAHIRASRDVDALAEELVTLMEDVGVRRSWRQAPREAAAWLVHRLFRLPGGWRLRPLYRAITRFDP